MGTILICREKHGEWYYPASTPEELGKSALQILTRRDADGYWYHDPEKSDAETQKYRPEALIENVIPDWPGIEAPIEERQAAYAAYKAELQEKYGDDPDVLALKARKLEVAVREYKQRVASRRWWREMREVVDNQDWESVITYKSGRTKNKAWDLLDERSDHEYEHVELENLQEVPQLEEVA